MKISTRGRYGLHLMLDLALCPPGEPLSLRDIAARQGLSDKYLEQIVALLQKAGLVRGVRGAGGGYRLTRAPEEISVGQVLRVLEGTTSPAQCVEEGFSVCARADSCVVADVLGAVRAAIDSVVDPMTLADMAEKQRQKNDYASNNGVDK